MPDFYLLLLPPSFLFFQFLQSNDAHGMFYLLQCLRENIRIHECCSDIFKTNYEIAAHPLLPGSVKLDVNVFASFVIQWILGKVDRTLAIHVECDWGNC